MTHEQVERINELARKKKAEGLTDAELAEQAALRRQYIDEFKANMKDVLDHSVIERPDGTRTPLTRKKPQ